MYQLLDQSSESCLVVHFSGRVTVEEYNQFLEAVDRCLQDQEKISLVVELAGFESYGDLATAKKDLQFAFKEYKKIQRAALVGDQKWIEWFARLVGPFTRAEEKHFPEGQLAEACSWACG